MIGNRELSAKDLEYWQRHINNNHLPYDRRPWKWHGPHSSQMPRSKCILAVLGHGWPNEGQR